MVNTKIWEVIGGAKQGGILVRKHRALSSPQLPERLGVGALVEEMEVVGDRLRVAKITGAGPKEGWISFKAGGDSLVVTRHPSKDFIKPGQTMTAIHCRIAQHMLKKKVMQPDIQSKFLEMEQKCGGDHVKYGKMLSGFLITQVYPRVVEHFGMVDPVEGAMAIFDGIRVNQPGNLEITTAWLELETLMRNQVLIISAKAALDMIRSVPSDQDSFSPGHKALDDEDDIEEQEFWDINGEVLGVLAGDRIRGGCKAVGCLMFKNPKRNSGTIILCRGCGRPNTEHEDKGAVDLTESAWELGEEAEDDKTYGKETSIVIRIYCLKVPDGSLTNILHVELPVRATVADLKAALSWGLPKNAHVFMRATSGSQASQPLEDAQHVPQQVVISELNAQVTPSRVLTRTQAREAQTTLMTIYSQPAFQKKLDSIEAAASGRGSKQNMLTTKMLATDVYPQVNRKFGLPEDEFILLPSVLNYYCQNDVAMAEKWLNLEILVRRKDTVAQAEAHLKQLRSDSEERVMGA